MIRIKYLYILFFVLLVSLVSCTDPDEYRVGTEFATYLQRFETEGAARGRTFDLQSTGLIIEFANLKDNTAGLTHYEDPIRIEIDQAYWNDITNTAGADLMKEDLIFHELGHGLLGRKHLNSILENGDWKSIMCGGDKVNGRSWNINYRGVRREYYLDELFDESTLKPEFASTQFVADTTGFTPVLKRNFDTADQAIWKIVKDTQHEISLENGKLRFQSYVEDTYLVSANLKDNPISILTDFSYELTLEYLTGDASNQYGIIFNPVPAVSSTVNDPVEYFSINNNGKMYMGNRSWYSYFTELNEPSIIHAGKNKLKVFKLGTVLYYFINDVYCYNSEIVANADLSQFGFMVPPQGTVWIDNFVISQRGSAKISPIVRKNQEIGFEIKTVKSLNQHIIYK